MVTEVDIRETDEQAARIPLVRMNHPGKGVLLGYVIEHDIHNHTKEEQEHLFKQFSENLCRNYLARASPKRNLIAQHVQNYRKDYCKLFTDN